jgi:two-component system chemotaxis response regulator CheY
MAINVLVVDDSSVMRSMIIKTMNMSGLALGEVTQAANGKEALGLLKEKWVDLVVADINMPVMNGEEMINRMMEDPELKTIPILVISTEASQARIESLMSKGASFIKKPFSPELIRNTIVKILGIEDHGEGRDQG